MSKILLDADLKQRLTSLEETTSIENDQGEVVAMIVPDKQYQKLLYSWLSRVCPVTPEQLDAARKEVGGKSLQDILARLEKS